MKLCAGIFSFSLLISTACFADGVAIEQVGNDRLPVQLPVDDNAVTAAKTPDLNIRPGIEKPKDTPKAPDYQQSVMQNTLTQPGRAQAAINEENTSALPDNDLSKTGKAKTYKEGQGSITVQEKKRADAQPGQQQKTDTPKPAVKSSDLGHSDIEQ